MRETEQTNEGEGQVERKKKKSPPPRVVAGCAVQQHLRLEQSVLQQILLNYGCSG